MKKKIKIKFSLKDFKIGSDNVYKKSSNKLKDIIRILSVFKKLKFSKTKDTIKGENCLKMLLRILKEIIIAREYLKVTNNHHDLIIGEQ